MKLLMCLHCKDIFNLSFKEKSCSCGEIKGKYIDRKNAQYSGNAQPIGIDIRQFRSAMATQRLLDEAQQGDTTYNKGIRFDTFFIPEAATSLKKA